MKLSIPYKWHDNDGNLDGLLFFAQRMDEMLGHYTIDIYKAPIFNSHLLLQEYLSVFNNKEISDKYLPIIYDEIKCSIQGDPILHKYWGNENIIKICDAMNKLPEKTKPTLINYLNHIWGATKYYDWCISYIKEIVPQSSHKEEIEKGLRCLVPELISKGYSPEFLYFYNKAFFFENEPLEMVNINNFLSRFDCKKRTFKVYIAAEHKLLNFKSLLENRLSLKFDDDGNYTFYKHDPDYIVLHFDNIKAYDSNNAAHEAYNHLNLFLRFYTAIDNKEPPKFQEKVMVFDEKSQKKISYVPFEYTRYSVIEGMEASDVSNLAEEVITNLIKYARCSLSQLTKAVDLHNNSLKSPDYSSSFQNLWSTLEVLSLDNIADTNLECVLGTLLPVLEKDYYSKAVEDFTAKLKLALHTTEYEKLLQKIDVGLQETEKQKIAEFLFLPKFKALRNDYKKKLVLYPVLRFRIHTIEDSSKESRNLLKIAENYKQRVGWHISRMYRIRNSIVHSGQAPKNIKMIGEHLHYYVDELLMEILSKLSSGVQFCTVDNVILDSILSCDNLKAILATKDEPTKEIIQYLLNPNFTPKENFSYYCCDDENKPC